MINYRFLVETCDIVLIIFNFQFLNYGGVVDATSPNCRDLAEETSLNLLPFTCKHLYEAKFKYFTDCAKSIINVHQIGFLVRPLLLKGGGAVYHIYV